MKPTKRLLEAERLRGGMFHHVPVEDLNVGEVVRFYDARNGHYVNGGKCYETLSLPYFHTVDGYRVPDIKTMPVEHMPVNPLA